MQIVSLCFFVFLLAWVLVYYAVPKGRRSLVLAVFNVAFILTLRRLDIFLAILSLVNMLLWTRNISRARLVIGISIQVVLMAGMKLITVSSWCKEPLFPALSGVQNSGFAVAGLSFYSLQVISYLVEMRRGGVRRRSIPAGFLYLLFAPKFYQGPIEKPDGLAMQLEEGQSFDEGLFMQGLQGIAVGLVYKLVLADRLSPYVINAFADPAHAHSLTLLAGAYLFSLQLYFDFAGYTYIALGIARLFGIRLTENFDLPFRSRSITELWRRWHITLIAWLTEYIYTPIAFRYRRFRSWAVVAGIACTFLLSGLWHGLGLTFLVWGSLHAVFVMAEFITVNQRRRLFDMLPGWVSWLLGIFLAFNLFSLANVFFRAEGMQEAIAVLQGIFTCRASESPFALELIGGGGWERTGMFGFVIVAVLTVLLAETRLRRAVSDGSGRWILLLTMILLLLIAGRLDAPEQFLYKQF